MPRPPRHLRFELTLTDPKGKVLGTIRSELTGFEIPARTATLIQTILTRLPAEVALEMAARGRVPRSRRRSRRTPPPN
jgi:hypothetical protein